MLEVLRSHSVHLLLSSLEQAISEEACTQDSYPIFANPQVILPNRGLESWLRQAFASKLGVCPPIHFSLPATFLWKDILRPLFPNFPTEAPLDEASLSFRLYRLLEDQDSLPSSISNWVKTRNSKRDQMDLARSLALELDRLLVHNPLQLFQYEENLKHSPAQQTLPFDRDEKKSPLEVLWQGILKQDRTEVNRGSIHALLLQQLRDPRHKKALASLPERIHLFMPGLLPEGLLAPFLAYAEQRTVRIYNLRPSPTNQWPGESLWNLNAHQQNALDEALQESSHLVNVIPEVLEADVKVPTIQLHGCHNPMREAEAVHDALLSLIKHEEINAKDVQILCVNVDDYAPALRATFNIQQPHLPLQVLNESAEISESLKAFQQMIELIASKVELSKFLAPLRASVFGRKFDLSSRDVNELHTLLHKAGARWGFDHKERPAFTLGFALRRLILGSLMDENNSGLSAAWAGSETPPQSLGQLMEWFDLLESFSRKARRDQNVQAWVSHTRELLDSTTLFLASESDELLLLESAFEELQKASHTAQFTLPIPFDSFRDLLLAQFEKRKNFGGPNGSILVSQIGKMRGIPAKVTVLMGFEESAFPGNELRSLFALDTSTQSANKRLEERANFVDALQCCSQHIIITATTFDSRDGSLRGWSPVIQELREAHPSKIQEITHKLHPFDPVYFLDQTEDASSSTPPRSFKANILDAANQAEFGKHEQRSALRSSLTQEELGTSEGNHIHERPSLEALIQFFKNPAKIFLKAQGISLPYEDPELSDSEPFESDGLETWKQRNAILEGALHELHRGNSTTQDLLALACLSLQSQERLAPEALGERQLELLSTEVEPLIEKALTSQWQQTHTIQLAPHLPVQGTLSGCLDEKRLYFSVSESRSHHLLNQLIKHIACCANSTTSFTSELFFRKKSGGVDTFILEPIEEASTILEALVSFYHRGVATPIPWSLDMALALRDENAVKANEAWVGGHFAAGLIDDPWVRHLWRQESFLDETLQDRMSQIGEELKPLLDIIQEVSK